MSEFINMIGAENMFCIIVILFSFINETTRFINGLYYSSDSKKDTVYNKKLNFENHFNNQKKISDKTINLTFYGLIMISMIVGSIVMFIFNALAGFALYMLLYIVTTWAYITVLLKEFHKNLIN